MIRWVGRHTYFPTAPAIAFCVRIGNCFSHFCLITESKFLAFEPGCRTAFENTIFPLPEDPDLDPITPGLVLAEYFPPRKTRRLRRRG